jgi:hypothetical protein
MIPKWVPIDNYDQLMSLSYIHMYIFSSCPRFSCLEAGLHTQKWLLIVARQKHSFPENILKLEVFPNGLSRDVSARVVFDRQGDQMGRIFAYYMYDWFLWPVFENYNNSPKFWVTIIHTQSLIWNKNGFRLDYIFWRFFTNSSGHPVYKWSSFT